MSGLCIVAGAATLALAIDSFTLAWTHSVERTAWEEDYRIQGGRLGLVEARVKGSGAGMEPGPGARLADGWFRYAPDLPPQESLRLARWAGLPDHRLCWAGSCRTLGELIGDDPATVVELRPCRP